MNFNRTIYSFAYKACLWSYHENLDGKAIIETKGINGIWTTLKDIPIFELKKRDDGVSSFLEITSNGIYGLRFKTTATPIGKRNYGRLCIDSLIFSTNNDMNYFL